MKKFILFFILLSLCSTSSFAATKPNVLLILADDLGYSDLGCYGGEIETPHLDNLANNGLRFTQFYNTARCWPTRGAMLTGHYAQQIRRDVIPDVKSGGRGTRPAWARLLPDMLSPMGYRSYHSGKWHIDSKPVQCGFHRSYYLRDQGRFFNPKVHFENDVKLPPVKLGSGYYGTVAVADYAIKYLKEHTEKHSHQPFFQYLAFAAPHFPLHALPKDIAKYRDKYKKGWEENRKTRWQQIQKMGLVNANLSKVERNVGPPYHFPKALEILGKSEVNRPLKWDDLTEKQKDFQATKMAIHAAMIDRMDQEIGRVLKQIKTMGELDNTLILFLSDNGASAEIMVRHDGHDPQAAPGSAATYLCLGPGWSTSSNTPFRRHKTWVHEGGISTPLIVHWGKGIAKQHQGKLRNNMGHVIDIVPTILEITGGERFKQWENQPVPAPPGKSLLPVFSKDNTVTHDTIWWLHEGNSALRKGDWKLVKAKEGEWELFNLKEDRTETNNLAKQHPEKVRDMEKIWTTQFNEIRKVATQDLKKQKP